MIRALAALLVVLSAIPSAHAAPLPCGAFGPDVFICVDEQNLDGDDLPTEPCPGWELHSTSVLILAGGAAASVYGSDSTCATGHSSGIAAHASAAGLFVHADWIDFSSGSYRDCRMLVASSATAATDLGCPAGAPPNPGWGRLLP